MNAALLPLPLADAGARYALRLAGRAAAAPMLPLAFDAFLYLEPAYLALQATPGEELFFYLEDHLLARTVAQWPVVVHAATAYSPYQAPFGGVQVAPAVPAAVVRAFLEAAHAALAERGVRHVRLRSYPASYDPAASALLLALLEELGYQTTLREENNVLPLQESFEAGLHPSERRRLRKCQRHGLQVEQETPLLLPLAYEYVQRWREEKGQRPPTALEHLQVQVRTFPNSHFLFSVRARSGEWAALTLLIRVNSRVLYVFECSSPLTYNAFSPVVLLMQGLHSFGQASGYELLDLGTATLPGSPNHSLLQFERHLGGVPGPRLTLEKQLSL